MVLPPFESSPCPKKNYMNFLRLLSPTHSLDAREGAMDYLHPNLFRTPDLVIFGLERVRNMLCFHQGFSCVAEAGLEFLIFLPPCSLGPSCQASSLIYNGKNEITSNVQQLVNRQTHVIYLRKYSSAMKKKSVIHAMIWMSLGNNMPALSVIPEFRMLKWADCKLKASLGYMIRPFQRNNKSNNKSKEKGVGEITQWVKCLL